MSNAARGALVAVALLSALSTRSAAQDTIAARPRWPLDTAKLRPFRHEYDMFVQAGDSMQVIGRRAVSLAPGVYAGSPAWVLVETRTGIVPAIETLYVTSDLKPLLWSSSLGAARLAIGFPGDSVYGASGSPGGRHNVVLAGAPKLIVSTTMVEALLPLLALTPAWSDSVAVLSVDQATSSVLPAILAVIGEEYGPGEVVNGGAWIVVLRAHALSVLFWVDKESGAVIRLQQPLPIHGATLLEYRRRAEAIAPSMAPPDQDAH